FKSDEVVMVLPSIAYDAPQNDGKAVQVEVDIWAHEQEARPGMAAALAGYMGIDRARLPEDEKARFAARVALFAVDSEGGKVAQARLCAGEEAEFPLPKTGQNGRSHAVFACPKNVSATPRIPVEIVQEGKTLASGIAFYAPPTGLSVISDIDDTIKDSHVLDRDELLKNTFLREYRAVPGMAERYQALAEQGAVFHYVSASPIQLYPALQAFMDQAGFPRGSFHLRETTSWRTIFDDKEASNRHKLASIEKVLTAWPQREFLLFGDDGERDPEIYAEIRAKYPGRIKEIVIRKVRP
ncbi:MAG: App1 family protein, partial [Zoogloeaceae bacterium]|nr:App1 family protein [Zoogloeaceae bacterium]